MVQQGINLADDGEGYRVLVDFAAEHMAKVKEARDFEALRVAAATLVSEVASEVTAEAAAETSAETAAETAAELTAAEMLRRG